MNEDERRRLERFLADEIGVTSRFIHREEAEFGEKDNWKNVRGHCLIEAARVSIFADILGFDRELTQDVALAALLHDGHKQQEIEAIQEDMRRGGSGRAGSLAATHIYLERLAVEGVRERVIRLIGFAGGMPEALLAARHILDQHALTNDDLAALLIHYTDAYTRNDLWTEPASGDLNDLDRRAEKNKNNSNYQKINDEIKGMLSNNPTFRGLTGFEAMVVLGREIEKKLSPFLSMRIGGIIEPVKIPETIDKLLRERVTLLA